MSDAIALAFCFAIHEADQRLAAIDVLIIEARLIDDQETLRRAQPLRRMLNAHVEGLDFAWSMAMQSAARLLQIARLAEARR